MSVYASARDPTSSTTASHYPCRGQYSTRARVVTARYHRPINPLQGVTPHSVTADPSASIQVNQNFLPSTDIHDMDIQAVFAAVPNTGTVTRNPGTSLDPLGQIPPHGPTLAIFLKFVNYNSFVGTGRSGTIVLCI